MRARVAASVALAALLSVGIAGCNFITPQASTKHYDPSDGVAATVGDVKVLNALAIAGDSAATLGDANLAFTAVNSSDDDVTLRVQYRSGGSTKTKTVDLPAQDSTKVGYGKKDQLVLTGFHVKPGALARIYFQYGTEQGSQLRVPVLDGASWQEYTHLQPSPTPTPKKTLAPTSTPTPSGSATPTP